MSVGPKPHTIGERFGRLVYVGSGRRQGNGYLHWFQCDCGKKIEAQWGNIARGLQKSCGCYKRDRASCLTRTHGLTNTPEFRAWTALKHRCNNPLSPIYKDYGGRGIKLHPRWELFDNFFADMGARPSEQHSIDRVDNNKGYEPGNCRWATRTEQNRNTRRNRVIEFDGRKMSFSAWAEESGIKTSTLFNRLQSGWSFARAIKEPPHFCGQRASSAKASANV